MSTVVFVCGASHSGTTMLDVMLGNAPNAFSCGELYAKYRPFRPHHLDAECSCGRHPCPLWQQFGNADQQGIHSELMQVLGLDFVIDSSKDLAWFVDAQRWLQRTDLEVANLLIWKSPVAYLYSHWKRERTLELGRQHFIQYYSRFVDLGVPFATVSYEELAESPGDKLKSTCESIGMEYFEGKDRFWEKEHHVLFGTGGIRKQLQGGHSRIYRPEPLPEQFHEDLGQMKRPIDEDEELNLLVDRLREKEVSRLVSGSARSAPTYHSSLRMPFWYHHSKLRKWGASRYVRIRVGLERKQRFGTG